MKIKIFKINNKEEKDKEKEKGTEIQKKRKRKLGVKKNTTIQYNYKKQQTSVFFFF